MARGKKAKPKNKKLTRVEVSDDEEDEYEEFSQWAKSSDGKVYAGAQENEPIVKQQDGAVDPDQKSSSGNMCAYAVFIILGLLCCILVFLVLSGLVSYFAWQGVQVNNLEQCKGRSSAESDYIDSILLRIAEKNKTTGQVHVPVYLTTTPSCERLFNEEFVVIDV